MHVYSPHVLAVLHELAREHGALVIHDEIATGFHRTGPLWAGDRVATTPDILCVGKALTGGYLTLAAVLCTREVAVGVSAGEAGALMHGPTFMGNPLACAIASANLDLLAARDTAAEVARLEGGLTAGLERAASLDCVAEVRTLGAVGVVQLRERVRVAEVTAAAMERGVWLRPFRDLVYTMPPYVTTDEDLALVASALVGAVEDVHG
jgi:adenosylmethionine-8-amino-7-oxononanoate aminotransferase